jgi:16S rRNA (guanine(966)-N(2))-methyltransferase RsmD
MRIIAGEFRSRRLFTPPDDLVTRPIPDRVRESLFGLLRGNCEGAQVFDAFAGTGAIGLEAISRGAARCVFVERDRHAAKMLQANIDALGCGDRSELVVGDALGAGALARCPRPLDLAFFDPPYPLVREPVGWTRVREQFLRVVALLSDTGFAVLRLPHPFVHEVSPDGSPIAPAPEATTHRATPRRKRPREDRFDWRRDAQAPSHDAREEPELDEAPDDTPAPETRTTDKVFPSLTLEGARGPETHVYHSTAVHLYMKQR